MFIVDTMKPVLAKILEGKENEVFGTKVVDLAYFSTTFHFHEECQLNYVIESEGKRMIGDSVESFANDELILVGSNIPHVWHNDTRYFEDKKFENHARSITLYFHPDKLLDVLNQMGNTQKLSHLFQVSKQGMKFRGTTKAELKRLLFQITAEKELLPRLTLLIQILNILSRTKDFDLLTDIGYINTYELKDNYRMDKILKYMFDNFASDIELGKAADLINMNKQAFCRYFKKKTQKTFVEFVNEVRIGHACKLIAEGEQQISSLAYACGFNSISNFNKFFKEIKGLTPKEYRKILITA